MNFADLTKIQEDLVRAALAEASGIYCRDQGKNEQNSCRREWHHATRVSQKIPIRKQ